MKAWRRRVKRLRPRGIIFPTFWMTVEGGYRRSVGSSTNTGPGMPDWQTWRALRTAGTMSATQLQVVLHLTMLFMRLMWSMSWREPLPLRMVPVAPPSTTTALSAILAFWTAVTVLVTPGPAVTHATPGRPVSRHAASAANTLVTS